MVQYITAVDPGPEYSAIVKWDGEHILGRDYVESDKFREYLSLESSKPNHIICEGLQCFGMAVGQSTFVTAYLVGSIREYCRTSGLDFTIIFRNNVKLHHCHSPRAKDANIRQALIDRLGAPGTKKQPGPTFGITADLWSALAIALYAWDTKIWNSSPGKNAIQKQS